LAYIAFFRPKKGNIAKESRFQGSKHMARAKRHYIPGYIWHITQRCHKREFLLRFAKDRHRWMQWLFEAKRRYGLTILNYIITSNHIHLLVKDSSGKDTISKSLQLVAGRTAQEFNQRKQRQGAFWQDRYHAVAIESGKHFRQCLVYIDMNMVRAGVVDHPSKWICSGYNEVQKPRRKYRLISYDVLMKLSGYLNYHDFQKAHRGWIEEAIDQSKTKRESHWTESIAVGSHAFVKEIKNKLAVKTVGRKMRDIIDGFELREPEFSYNALFEAKKEDIG
jgi:putative transposase